MTRTKAYAHTEVKVSARIIRAADIKKELAKTRRCTPETADKLFKAALQETKDKAGNYDINAALKNLKIDPGKIRTENLGVIAGEFWPVFKGKLKRKVIQTWRQLQR